MRTILLVSLFISFFCQLPAQNNFPHFKEGIYYTHHALKANIPNISFDSLSLVSEKFVIKTSHTLSSPHRIKKLKIKENGKQSVRFDIPEIWALFYNSTLYIQLNQELVRVIKFGAFSHFALETIRFQYTDATLAQFDNGRAPQKETFSERKHRAMQFVLDFETGDIRPFNEETMTELLKRDPVLFEQFAQETDKQMKLFLYLLEYNQRNPVTP